MTTKPQANPPATPPKEKGVSAGAKRRAEREARRRQKAVQANASKASEAADLQAEGFTGRQLRNAMRLAQRKGLVARDPFDAIQKLRSKGIDPLEPSNPLHLVVDNTKAEPAQASAQPSVFWGKSPAQAADEKRQILEINQIQKEIAQRRTRQFEKVFLRLYIWVIVPTLAALFYFGLVATPMFSTTAEFIVQKSGGGGGLGALFSGTALGSSQEAIAVQSYIESKEAMIRLNESDGFINHFSGENIDFLHRLEADSSNEDAYALYKRKVKVAYDPTEGIVRMEVRAADPATAVAFSQSLVRFAEEVVNDLSLRQRVDQLAGAQASFEAAETDMQDAQRKVLTLQEARGVVSAEAEVSALMAQISTFELQLRQEQLKLDSLLDNTRPNMARVTATRRNIDRLGGTIAGLRAELTNSGPDNTSLAKITSELRVAEAALATRQLLFQNALQQLQTARRDVDRQVGYLELNVAPVLPQEATYPRIIENTAMAFLIFAGIYLLISLTASVLKEQVSS